ncbi:MAG: family 20 glycosylhydrolase [Bacteroidaceae bacterium]|nr:family 20 glycosylhydrolase [Bacteroidaceae bacterium]
MKKIALLLLAIIIGLPTIATADSKINLTPVPKQMTVGEGKLVLPKSFTISTGDLDADLAAEGTRFAKLFCDISGYSVSVVNSADALITMQKYTGNEELGNEGYTLDIAADGITIAANSANGFYYAFQSVKKMLPANIMAEVKDANITEYSLPIVSIVDAPRFEYRGFMLDVSRHYFTTDQIKRMIDVMSYYKMNRFHWHLTDDQGWRFEVKKYPRLTTVGATRSNSWSTDPVYGGYYDNEPYGPYFYTQEECRDIVAYAAERHIEVVPEVEFPGHSCAVNAAYPEFSCNPNGAHNVQVNGGIFSDVLNVANPHAVQFVKDVLDEVIEVFPYHQIHIGGDETPTNAWQNNAECQALMQKMGYSNIRQLQSHFVREISDHVTSKEGDKKRTVIMWNESLTANGTDENLIKGTGGTMMCWEIGNAQACALKAAEYGMKSIITTQVPYYINRRQSTDADEPPVAGYGTDNVKAVYDYVPVPASVPAELQKYYIGVQGTFWTEHVQSNYLLEYLALPRLIAIAETGWTPAEKKNFSDFQQRITKDTLLLNYNNYEYGRHYILGANSGSDAKVMPTPSTDENSAWYRIVTTATDARAGRCIQLLREGSSEIGTGNAQANRLWNSAIIEDENDEGYNYQLWAFMQDPNNAERWAIVNKAKPNGSVKGTPTAENNTGRWDYDDNNRHYDFILGDKVYAQNGNNYNYSIRSQKVSNTNMCLNYAGPGQTYSINLWSNPADGNGGIWEFRPLVTQSIEIKIDYPVENTCYRIVNNTERFNGWTLYDNNDGKVTAAKQKYGFDVWEIAESAITDAGQTFKLRNVTTGRYISTATAPLALGESGVTLTNVYNTKSGDFSIKTGDAAIYPLPERAATNPNTLSTGGIYPQGTGWVFEKACIVTYVCKDENGSPINNSAAETLVQSVTFGSNVTATAPEFANYEIVKYNDTNSTSAPVFTNISENKVVNVTYRRVSNSITYRCYTVDGNHIADYTTPCIIGESHTVVCPEIEFFTLVSSNEEQDAITPAADTVIEVYYDSEGIMGVAAIGEAVTELEAGASYLIYNAKNEAARSGFLSVSNVGDGITTTNGISDANPGFVWNFEGDGNKFTVKNNYGVYIPQLLRGTLVTGGSTPEEFLFTLNNDNTWSVQGTSNNYYWNGNANNTFTGWDSGHPFIIYTYKPHPYFNVSYTCVDEKGSELASGSRYVKGGEAYNLLTPIIKGYTLVESDAVYADLAKVSKNIELTLKYSNNETAISEVKAENIEEGIYDLSGRKITAPTKGIYIKDGKKVIIR